MEMVNTSILGMSTQGAAATAIEAGAPELRFLREIQISQQHNIVMTGSANHSHGAASTDADSLVWAIQHTHSSFEQATRGQNPDGDDNKVCGSSAAKKYGSCDCNYSFECNICLDMAKQPVVTPCVHLFWWPCLHQWLHAPSPFSECPVCKGEVLEANVTPIYETGGEEVYSTGNPDLPPQAASKQKGQPEPTAANGRHKRNCNSGEGVDTKPGCSEGPPNPGILKAPAL